MNVRRMRRARALKKNISIMKEGRTSDLRDKSRVSNSHSNPRNTSSDIAVSYHGSILLFHPLTEAARDWVRTHCPADADHIYFGRALVVEPRYAADLLVRAQEDGLNPVQR
jgi:hypothetical protein